MTLTLPLKQMLDGAPNRPFPWDEALRLIPALAELKGSEQDPIYHREGDAWKHTKLVCEALWQAPGLHRLPTPRRHALVLAALLHDIAKPQTQQRDKDGRIHNPGHARRGAVMAERLLWQLGIPFELRRLAVALIRHHMVPMHLLKQAQIAKKLHALSWQLYGDDLARLAEADTRGRDCDDQGDLLEAIALFRQACEDEDCLTQPRVFSSALSRTLYFRKERRDPNYKAHDETWGEVVLLSGLPGAGKTHLVNTAFSDLPVIDLDSIRKGLGQASTGHQGPVLHQARDRAREFLRAKTPFVWSATNLSRQRRAPLVDLFIAYGARVHIVYVEASLKTLFAQNASRESTVPEAAIWRMMRRWEVPTLLEAQAITYHIDGEPRTMGLGCSEKPSDDDQALDVQGLAFRGEARRRSR